MYIKKQVALRQAQKWVDDLKHYRDTIKENWDFVGREARETIGRVYALWLLNLITDKEWETLYDEIWAIICLVDTKTGRSY